MRARALTRGGALAACAVGTLTYGAGGWAFTLILLAFFLPSVALSRVGRARKKLLKDIGKGGARDAWQVLANGGVATACAVAAATRVTSNGLPNPVWSAAFAGAYAAATADTWGTEIGTLMRGSPRSILTLRPIAAGFSGGVTLGGTAAEITGAAWLAACAATALGGLRRGAPGRPHEFTPDTSNESNRLFAAVFASGVVGAFVDSVLGATVQELRRCPACERNCETNPHDCGTPTTLMRGIPGFSNDLVNFAATLSGAAAAFSIARLP